MQNVKQGMPVLGAPSGPKMREWGKPQNQPQGSPQPGQGMGKGPQGYDKPIGFVKAGENGSGKGEDRQLAGKSTKTDEELEAERKETRKRDEELSFRDVSLLFVHVTDPSGIMLLNNQLTIHDLSFFVGCVARTPVRTS